MGGEKEARGEMKGGGCEQEGKSDRMISLKRRRMRRSGCGAQRRIDDLLSGLYNLGSWEI